MKKTLLILLILISSCSTNKVVKNHGSSLIKSKSEELIINRSNKNDILELLGPPSTKSSFNENLWIYIETKKVSTSIFRLGKRSTDKNNILIVQLDSIGLVKSKEFYDLEKMNNLQFSEKITSSAYQKDSFVYNLLTSLRNKINSPIERTRSK